MKKYEVIDYEVRANPVAEPVASSTERLRLDFNPFNHATNLHRVWKIVSRRAILSRIHPGTEPFWERLTMWNTLNLSRAVM